MKARLLVLALAVTVAWGLKRHYADASVEDLWWMLAPTASLVGLVTDSTFAAVTGEGYLSHARMFVIEKSCAGINFMIAAFGMLVLALRHRIVSATASAGVLTGSLLASYCAAVLVNATRITVAMWLAEHPSAVPALSAAEIHRLEGIVIYFAGLVLLHGLVRQFERQRALAGCKP